MPDVYDQALSGATPQPQTNAYDALLDQQDQQQNQQLMQSIAQNAGKDANLEGEAQRLGFKTGIGADIAKNNMAEVRRRAAVIDAQNRQLTETSPILARQLSDPSFAAIAHDQLDNLSTHEKIWSWLKTQSPISFQAIDGIVPSVSINPDIPNQWEAGQLQHEAGLLGFKAGTGGASADDWTRINEIKQRLSQLGPQKSFLGGATQMAGQMKDMGIGALGAGAVGGLIAGGATAWASGGLAAEAVPEASMLGAKLGASVWASQDIYRMTAGQTYLDMLDKGINQSTAQYAAAGVGMINTALMMGGTKVATAPFAKALNAAMGEKLSEAMVRPTVARAMRSVAGEWALGSVEGGGAMALQTVVSQVGEDVAKSYDKGQLDTVLSTPEGRSEFAGRVVDSFVTGLTLTGLTGAAGSMLRLHVEAGKVAEAQRSQQFFESLSQNAADSEVRKRNPNAYENFVASQAKGTNAESVYVDGQKMAEVLNQSGLDPEQVERVLPGMSEKVAEAAQTGGDVTIPTSQYAANLAGTELGKAMLPHMRLDPDGISAAEAEAFAQNHQSMLAEAKATAQQQMSTNDEFAKSAKVVEGNIFDQLKATKTMPDDVARTNAQFMRDLIVTQAADMKITPEEFYQRFKPTIERATGVGVDQASPAGSARGGFDPSRLAILMNDKADFSTFAHETGHYYLSVIGDLAKDKNAPGRYKHDMQTLLNWFGVKDLDTWHSMSLDGQRKFHEQFAYSFEKYLAEGKAPSLEMQGVFDRFAMWLKRVYVSVRDDLNSIYRKQHGEDLPVLTGEVRGVMDRMLASDDQIKQAEAVRNMEPMFRSAEEAGMKPEEWAAYQEMHRDATGSASSDLTSASIRQMQWLSNARSRVLKELQKQHDALRDKVREEVTAEVMEQPIHQAMADLKEGKDPELVALAHGFDSKDDMMGQRVTKKALKEQVASLTDQRMTERYGEMNDPKAMEREVEKALHNEARARFVAVELRHLAKATEPVRVMLKAAELTAKNILGSKPLSEVKPSEYAASEARAARAAIDAMKKGDSEGAAKAKQNQLVQNALAKEALSVRDEADRKLKYLGKFDNLSTSVAKSIGADYMDRINELLSGYEISKRATHGQGREDISSWVLSEYNKTGIMPSVSPDIIAQMGTMHWKDMSISQLRDLHDAVKSLDYVGRRRTEVEIAGKVQTVDELIQEVRNNLADVKHTEPVDVRSDMRHAKGLDKINASWLYAKGKIRSMDAALLKMEQLFQWLDAGKDAGVSEAPADGPMQRLFHMASSAEGKERAMRAESSRALRELGDNLKGAKIDLHEALDIPELPRADGSTKWYREELIAMALNMGNESNKQKLLEGYNWSEERAVGAINRIMSKPEMDFVQGVWDHIGTYGEGIVELQRRQTGVMPKMIEGSTLVTAHGAYPGGYYPAVYDSFIDRSIEEKEARSADRLFENNYANPATSTGHTIERTGYKGPIWLDLSVISRHIDQVTHDLAWREAITDMNKVLSDPRLHREVDQTYGREYAAQFRPWLQAMANDRVFNTSGDAGWEWLVRKARTNATMVGVGFRMSTLMIHGTSALSNSLGELGTKWFAKGAQQFIGADRIKETRDFIFARSPEMKHRMDAVDRNMTEVINEINKNQDFLTTQGVVGKIYDSSRKFACYGVAMSDMASAMPTWMGAYLKGMAKDGLNLSEADAVEYANRSVRNAHGGGGTKDLASAQRDRGVTSLFTMFYSFWNHMYNRQRDLGKGWQQTATGQAGTRNLPRLLARSWFYFVVPQLAHVLLKPSPAEKKDEGDLGSFAKRIGEDIGAGSLSGLPVFRDMASAAINGRDYTVTPLEQVGKSIVTTIENGMKVAQGEPTSKRASQTAAEAAGYIFGIPTAQPVATTRFLWDVLNGDQQPDDMKDWWSGILTGKITR
jgi:hypothetical protein